ncbi:MAG TPA: hypothetical protein PKG56_05795 [Chitinophagaceae bacterium]|nr:hypothetical protein [Chitinophagaceae bacterium]MCC6635633.1 hypothetical protein [Chitinophagaceae bacterium]HMZ46756.1 hypothetical protein [Chitinophagaceae bacterium]HNF29631.1 hypothetical protein [Chitinophagaceae bacterium]HNJ59164.1 hypothetical protein [Chitinophagaceae bacterium]
MKYILTFSTFFILLLSCKEQKKEQEVSQNNIDTLPYYNYTAAINTEADSLIKIKKQFLKIVTNPNNSNNASKISLSDFKNLVQLFTQQNISEPPLKQFYKEQIFTDLTTNSTIINYTTSKDSLPVKNISIMLDAKNANTLKRIDIKNIYSVPDTLITENYAWIFGKEFYFVKYYEPTNSIAFTTKTNISFK